MNLKEMFIPDVLKIIVAVYMITVHSISSYCMGGFCYGFPLVFYTNEGFSVLYLIINILIFYVAACVVVSLFYLFKEKRIVKYLLLILFFWLSLFLVHLLNHFFRYPSQITDPDTWEMATIFPLVYTVPFAIAVVIVAVIVFIVKKVRQ
jgi:hypothetical protein